jgi:imidazolonepropionase-like amidohydrolase
MLVKSLLLALLPGALVSAAALAPAAPESSDADAEAVVITTADSERAPAPTPAPAVPTAPVAAVDIVGETLLIQAARVIVRPGKEIKDAQVLVQNGRIVAVGQGLVAPEGARVIEGEVVCAAFLDPWSTIGLDPASAQDLGVTPATLSVDALNSYDGVHLRKEALREGVTCARVQVGVRALIGGVGAVVRTADGLEATGGEVVMLADACAAATVGVTRGGRLGDIFDRVSEVGRVVGQIERGRAYREGWVEYRHDLEEWEKAVAKAAEKYEKDFKKAKKARDKKVKEAEEKEKEFKEEKFKEDKKPRMPKYDPDAEALARIAAGELPLVIEVHRVEEIRALLKATADFDRLRLVLAGGTEAAFCAEELAERHIPVIVWPAPLPRVRTDELDRHDLGLAGKLAEAGVRVLIGTGGGARACELRTLAALAVGHGLHPDAALAAITSAAASTLDLREVLGTVERGKHAELLVLDGNPLDSTTRIQFVISHGQVVVE